MIKLLSTLSWFSPQAQAEEQPEPQIDRNSQRLQHCLRITSPDLPNCRALSVDLSSAGLCLETFLPVKPGQVIKMSVELGHEPVSLDGTVEWCRPLTDGIFRVGLSLDRSRQQNLHSFRRYFRQELHNASTD